MRNLWRGCRSDDHREPGLSEPWWGVGQKRQEIEEIISKKEKNHLFHDEILMEAPIEESDEVALIVKETMKEAGLTFLKTVPVEAEVVIVGSWAEK